MNDIFGKIREMIASLSLVRKISMLTVLALSVGVIGFMVHVSRQAAMEPLFTNLNSDDMGEIITRLDKQGIHYEVDHDKRTVTVPATDVLNVRLKMAEEGLPRFGGIGFELFDRAGFGMSEFEQRINYQRALEGELTRTISNIREVQSTRVHLVLPEKSLFSESKQEASASVVLKLGNASTLNEATVRSIQHLVASAVEGLDPTKVTIVDTAGHMLAAGGEDSASAASSNVLDQKMQIERSYEHRIVELISPVVGLGKVIARVTATIDFTQTENTDESVDPQKVAVVSESRTAAKRSESSGSGGGAAGAGANLPGGAGGASGSSGSGNADESSEQITYAVSKTTLKKITPIGAVQKLSVAVLVDGLYDQKDGKPVYKPRDAKEIGQIEELVKRAVGFDGDRGDQMKIENLEFKAPEFADQGEKTFAKRTTNGFIISLVGNLLVVLVALLVILFVIRPLMQSYRTARGGGTGEGEQLMLEGGNAADVGQLVRADPAAAANAIKQWLHAS